MKLNKVYEGRENPGEGTTTLVGPAQPKLGTPCTPVFLLLPGGRGPT